MWGHWHYLSNGDGDSNSGIPWSVGSSSEHNRVALGAPSGGTGHSLMVKNARSDGSHADPVTAGESRMMNFTVGVPFIIVMKATI